MVKIFQIKIKDREQLLNLISHLKVSTMTHPSILSVLGYEIIDFKDNIELLLVMDDFTACLDDARYNLWLHNKNDSMEFLRKQFFNLYMVI